MDRSAHKVEKDENCHEHSSQVGRTKRDANSFLKKGFVNYKCLPFHPKKNLSGKTGGP